MEKQKPWQFYLILTVILLTLYNILPTLFWYAKPLKEPITEPRAHEVVVQITDRVNRLEEESKEWIASYGNLLKTKPVSIAVREDDPRLVDVTFANERQAGLFKRYLPRAGQLIPFIPSQLDVYPESQVSPNKVIIARQLGMHLNPEDQKTLFHYISKYDEKGLLTQEYKDLIYNRAGELAKTLAGPSAISQEIAALLQNPNNPAQNDAVVAFAKEISDLDTTLGSKYPTLTNRVYASFILTDNRNADTWVPKLQALFETVKVQLVTQKDTLTQDLKKQQSQSGELEPTQAHTLKVLDSQIQALDRAKIVLTKHADDFKSTIKPLTDAEIRNALTKSDHNQDTQTLSLEGRHPFVEALVIDWTNDSIRLKLFDDIHKGQVSKEQTTEAGAYQKEKINSYIINEMARVSRQTDESIQPMENDYAINLNQLGNTRSFLVIDLRAVAEKQSQQLVTQIQNTWQPKTDDLKKEAYPIRTYSAWLNEKPEEQKLGIVVYSPVMDNKNAPEGFHSGSMYAVAKGLNTVLQKYRDIQNQSAIEVLIEDLNQLKNLLHINGFIGYSGASVGISPEFSKDYIFENGDYYGVLLKATREDFEVKGNKRYAVLPFTDVEQRILTTNRIDDRIQEDLLKWKEEYSQAQVDLNAANQYMIPAPTENPYWSNLKLSIAKYFRGDDRKILKWGIDLSGGKTVRIGLRDQNNRPVTNQDDIRQTVNELYTRINKMGVSERVIRIENENIVLEFPGSQNLSAADLVQASAMYFHIVNEKFTPNNPTLKDTVNTFLQDIWNEAVITNHKDVEGVNQIAWEHLGGGMLSDQAAHPRSEAARLLYESGLRLANPKERHASNAFDDTLSTVAIMHGDDFAEWEGQSHPLMIVFHNYALEGSSLTNIQVGYDPSEGNTLSFGVKRSYEGSQARAGSPREDFYTWTSQFAEDRIAGTVKETFSHGHGWRMAVLLNGRIITKPTLRAALNDSASITGRFTQREINKLAADLKAGSLSFTPIILSEQNVSPELGTEERSKGIIASVVALVLVVAAMVGYYRFAGVVASVAVIFNILIMWGVLQNLGAALTLPGIAGIVLTIGMAVDANVLVFERIREEFKLTGRIASSIQAGYRKAFSAIVDSNITTIIAALILLQFDSGPIKGFAVTLIIGIVSSMFTALFMTRYFFAGWVQNPNHKSLTMSEWIGNTNINFLKQAKTVIIVSLIVMVAGMGLLISERKTIFGMDFTGGYALQVEVEAQPGEQNYRVQAYDALLAAGATANDVEVRQLTHPNQLKIQLGMSMEENGHSFHGLQDKFTEGNFAHEYQKNPRITWVVNALEKGGLKLSEIEKTGLENDWTVMSGQLSDTMRNNAIIALVAALLCILVYIAIRFEIKYAIGAVVGLAHDVIITLGFLALFHRLGFPVQIDLEVIGAIMTIIGYSLNDTIIVFDRVREEVKLMRKMPFTEVVNHALNITLSRTLMTSGTTILVLLALVLLGGHSIFSFSLVMLIGVVVGTLSSLYVASPVMLYFHNREVEAHQRELQSRKA